MNENVQNVEVEKIRETPVCKKPCKMGKNALCWTALCALVLVIGLLTIGSVIFNWAIRDSILWGHGYFCVLAGLIGIIFGIINPSNLMDD